VSQLDVMGTDGSNPVQLTSFTSFDDRAIVPEESTVTWSADSRSLYFDATETDSQCWTCVLWFLEVVDADGHKRTEFGPSRFASWAPDGSMLAYATPPDPLGEGWSVEVTSGDGSSTRELVASNWICGPGPFSWWHGSVVYGEPGGYGCDAYAVRASGGTPRPIAVSVRDWAASPDGAKLAIARGDAVLLVGPAGRLRPLARDRAPNWLAWSSDGRLLAYVSKRRLIVVDVVHSDKRVVASMKSFPAGSRPGWTRDGRIVFAASR